MSMQIKRVSDLDNGYRRVADLAAQIWTEHYTPIIGAAQVAYMLSHFQSAEAIAKQCETEGYQYYMVYDEDNPAGYYAVKPEPDGTIFLSKLYIAQSHRGHGLAKALCAGLVKEYKNRFRAIRLTVNKNNAGSIAAYKKMGFQITDELVADIGGGYVMDDYEMKFIL